MSIRGAAFIAGAYEHPGRVLPDTSTAQIHVEAAIGALVDAGLDLTDVDGYFCSGDAPGGPIAMADHLGLAARHIDSTDLGGSSYVAEVSHAAQAIAAGKCKVALITMGGRPRSAGRRVPPSPGPAHSFEAPHGHSNPASYALAARRHMHEFGTTSAQLAEVKVAAATHAQHNPQRLPSEAGHGGRGPGVATDRRSHCTDWTVASSPTAAGRWSWWLPRWRGRCPGGP